ncbi:TrbC/VirB2 family protein [Azohydromonas lata]|uniref:TrbC/VirB2 family protein n=1 Tax=Azohydromonas lata TaxID=45677 RepID=A0ABU5ISA8_9BURK|nr:TrbC/VirB2 family protein [Azohydromonas lata]MDZ5461761.1 TrbC/VirB2 family protein [Azohydromonas lata]
MLIALVVQGIRCWRGHIDIMAFGGWAIGIIAVFFAPNIVQELRAGAAGVI